MAISVSGGIDAFLQFSKKTGPPCPGVSAGIIPAGAENDGAAPKETSAGRVSKKPIVVSIEGVIGAGKSTLIKHIEQNLTARGLKAVIVPEPVDEWKRIGILQEFYADKPPEYRGHIAYAFQTYTFVTRVQSTREVVEAHPDADVYLLERSVLTDRFVFMELQRDIVGPVRMEMYDKWWEMWALVMPICPEKFVYLKPTLANCQLRVEARARDGETSIPKNGQKPAGKKRDKEGSARGGVSLAYQARLQRAHEAYLLGEHADEFPGMPARPFDLRNVIVVDGDFADDDFSEPGEVADRVANFAAEKILGGT